MGSIRPKIRSLMAGQSARSVLVRSPSWAPWRAARATSAGYTSILDGMQPRFMQVPPKAQGSAMAMSQWSCSGPMTEFPEPPPRMRRS